MIAARRIVWCACLSGGCVGRGIETFQSAATIRLSLGTRLPAGILGFFQSAPAELSRRRRGSDRSGCVRATGIGEARFALSAFVKVGALRAAFRIGIFPSGSTVVADSRRVVIIIGPRHFLRRRGGRPAPAGQVGEAAFALPAFRTLGAGGAAEVGGIAPGTSAVFVIVSAQIRSSAGG